MAEQIEAAADDAEQGDGGGQAEEVQDPKAPDPDAPNIYQASAARQRAAIERDRSELRNFQDLARDSMEQSAGIIQAIDRVLLQSEIDPEIRHATDLAAEYLQHMPVHLRLQCQKRMLQLVSEYKNQAINNGLYRVPEDARLGKFSIICFKTHHFVLKMMLNAYVFCILL